MMGTVTGERFSRRMAWATFGPLVLAAVAFTGVAQGAVVWMFAAVGAPHVAAGFAFYFDQDARPVLAANRLRFYVVPAALVAGLAAVGAVAVRDDRTVGTLIAGFLMWQAWHFTRQNIGVLALVARTSGAKPMARQVTLIQWGGYGAILSIPYVAAWATRPTYLPDAVATNAWRAGGLILLGCLAVAVRDRDWWAIGFTGFHLPLISGSFVMSFGGWAVSHAVQYHAILWSFDRRARWRTAMVVLALGLGVGVLGRSSEIQLTSAWAGAALGAIYGIVSWHFVLDAGIWRMSRPEVRAYLTDRMPWLGQQASTAIVVRAEPR